MAETGPGTTRPRKADGGERKTIFAVTNAWLILTESDVAHKYGIDKGESGVRLLGPVLVVSGGHYLYYRLLQS